jgi:hypothetical protein
MEKDEKINTLRDLEAALIGTRHFEPRRSSKQCHAQIWTQCSGLAGIGGCSPAHRSARSRNSNGEATGCTCWNPMAASSREFCLLAKSRLSDVLSSAVTPRF